MIDITNLVSLTTLEILIPFNCYDMIALALLYHQKNEKNLFNNQLALTITLWLPIKRDICRYIWPIVNYAA